MKKELVLKIVKDVLYVIFFAFVVGFIYHWARGIYCSLIEDDVITAQNRINSAYQFIAMAGSGLIALVAMFSSLAIKAESFIQVGLKKCKALLTKKK